MTSRPRVTVVIATFDYAPVLRTAIASVLGQSFQDWELRVVGDACRDESEAVVRSFRDPRIHWSNLPVNTGFQSGPNNAGIEQARGDLIAYLSHDDLWLPNHLACAVSAIDAGADLTYGLALRVVPGARNRVSPLQGIERKPKLVASQVVHRHELVVRVGGWRFPRELAGAPGRDLWTRMRKGGARLVGCQRLTVVKFPARHREGVYRDRPAWEQTRWLARIRSERDLEIRELANPQNPPRRRRRLLKLAWRVARAERRWSALPWLLNGAVSTWARPQRNADRARGRRRRAAGSSYEDKIVAKRRFNGLSSSG